MREAASGKVVYIVDDEMSVRHSLGALLSAHGFQTEAFPSAESFLEAVEADKGLCAFIDLRMPGLSGMELQKIMSERAIGIPVVILTGHGDVPLAVEAMKNGAVDFIEKPGSEEQLLGAIRASADQLANRPSSKLPPHIVSERLARLTGREREVLDHLVLGMTNKHIAVELGISQRTVEIHRARIREKLEARGLADLIRMMR
ncbi:FixJ family two-component response regulator [Rhodopseudomonas julia]|uniref:FixJ family two-component response regulator n=1 Tax=Rhodopseudomonas julia TaxID=200617 RepID=A0ABU0CB12_9BRAD|nr:response regulator [Rhodopseudomonas julia]MDQ0327368.1 FixJ family two-component response regulator [Rhodopseudomonas julia]